ncbi:hypothetical protein M406DRAFT_106134 [Cryphonectria parasitica EP155]|uniref:Ankyrin n=1 Tax=Cryphonectria parasitica (strain ATCC 38755 / EP155) TaxID=660469 RepID=A0A9P4Y454_CRYP1|nr:uncharacterized protein M406DRAFT_106134 [Cryphonectria parasitica EP155]KAF3766196.1 hypothetical protein M406DRAFT_106134 [Cryphonectria parasitica EP155]
MLIHKGADVNVTGLNFRSMPLFAACLPVRRFHQTDNVPVRLEDAERIVRTLAARGADVTATKGISLFTALCAAALCAGVGTINFLLDKSASVRSPDPLGRLPIHFAAANGIRNFETIVLAHGEDIMIPDNFKKNALHWAAQFGNAETVKAILQKLSPKEKRIYVNFADADGWTPLAWASRQTEPSTWVCWTKSEPQDYEATMKCLIGHGADISVTFHMSQGVDAEELTPLKMAKRSGFGEAVIQLLTPKNVLGKEASEEPMYTCLNDYCNFCLSLWWNTTFEGLHTFHIPERYKQEFVARSSQSVTSDSVANDEAPTYTDNTEMPVNESTPEGEETDFNGNDIVELDLPALDDLGGLDEL